MLDTDVFYRKNSFSLLSVRSSLVTEGGPPLLTLPLL